MPKYLHPLKHENRVSDNFADHVKRGAKMPGLDFPTKVGTPVYATRSGTVRKAEDSKSLPGIWVQLSHVSGSQISSYMHLSKVVVKRGQKVHIGDLIGYSGNTGNSQGPHLHFCLRILGKYVDPTKLLVVE